jgi:hypothetical protein
VHGASPTPDQANGRDANGLLIALEGASVVRDPKESCNGH